MSTTFLDFFLVILKSMTTVEKIRLLSRQKLNMSLTELEESLGWGNGSLSKKGYMRSDRLLIVATKLGVTMDSLMNDNLEAFDTAADFEIAYLRHGGNHSIDLTDTEKELVLCYRKASDDIKAAACAVLGVKKDSESRKESVSNL